jgi:glucose/arabinose dehydrogenase
MSTITNGLNFPTGFSLGDKGEIYVAESGLPFGGAPMGGRVLCISVSGETTVLLEGLRPPLNGVTLHEGYLYLSEGGYPGRISRDHLESEEHTTLLDNLPGFGNYQTNMVAIGPDGLLYFSQGALTNSGIIGLDSYDLGWLKHVPHNCDIPGYEIVLGAVAKTTADPRAGAAGPATTGAFAPFGASNPAGEVVPAQLPCTASVMRCRLDGSGLELVAWGLRNAYGLGFLPDGRLLATDQGADVRGSRPLANCPDALFEVRAGAWYGWPDFICGRPATLPEFAVDGSEPVEFVLSHHRSLPPPESPLFEFPVNSAPVKFEVMRSGAFAGDLLVALFGDERPLTAPTGPRVGRHLVRISTENWTTHPVAAPGLKRPIDVSLDSMGNVFALDFGHFEINPDKGLCATPASGAIHRFQTDCLEDNR